MRTAFVDTQLELKSREEKAALEEILAAINLDNLRYKKAIKIGFSVVDYLDIALDGEVDALDEFEEILEKIAPCIARDESFIVTMEDEYGEDEYMYKFTGYSVKRFTGTFCFPDNGFYPMETHAIISAIKSDPRLEAEVRKALSL